MLFRNLRRTFSILCTRQTCTKRNLPLTAMNCLGLQLVAGVCCNPHRVREVSTPNLRRTAAHSKQWITRVALVSVVISRSRAVLPNATKRWWALVVFLFTPMPANGAKRPALQLETQTNALHLEPQPNIKD